MAISPLSKLKVRQVFGGFWPIFNSFLEVKIPFSYIENWIKRTEKSTEPEFRKRFIVRSFDSRSPSMGRPAYTENTSKWGRFEFGLLASEDAELTMPHHFEEASVYMGSFEIKISSK